MITEDDEFERIEREQKMRLDLTRDNMTKLTEASLAKALKEIQQMLEQPNETIKQTPTKLLIQPAALAELGLTVDDVKKMIRHNQ
jgi:predicted Zn-ribbon and HTH transcriptional regulator